MANEKEAAPAKATNSAGEPMDEGTRLAYERTILAHERTLMAWLRTAISLITFGFTLYKFFALELAGKVRQPVRQVIGPREFALLMIVIGLFALVVSTVENVRYRKSLRRAYASSGYSLTSLVTALISGLGLLALASVIFRW